MKGELERVFGEKGELHACLEKIFGDDGKLARDLLDMNKNKSPIGQLRKTIESYFVGKDSQMYGMLDPYSKDSPMARLKTEILQKLEKIETDVATYIGKKKPSTTHQRKASYSKTTRFPNTLIQTLWR